MSLKDMLEEEAELDKEFLALGSDPDDSATPPIPNVDTFDLDEDSDEKDPTDPPEGDHQESKESEAEKKTRQSWKQRYASFKASADKTIHNLRKENTDLRARLDTVYKKNDDLASRIADLMNRDKDAIGEVITPEDIALIGPEAVDIVKKATKKATETAVTPLVEEINRIKARELEEIKRRAEHQRTVEYNSFISDLGKLVPDYAAINLDTGFEKFMNGEDASTGERRLDAFRRAEDYLDAYRVADFFLEYKANIPRSKKEMLEDKITPTGNASSAPPNVNKKDTFTMAEVNKFFDEAARGLYKNRKKEADEIEARITKAYVSGNIVD